MNCSKHLNNTGASGSGGRSLWMKFGCCISGKGLMSAHFHSSGIVPSLKLPLKFAHTGGASMVAI